MKLWVHEVPCCSLNAVCVHAHMPMALQPKAKMLQDLGRIKRPELAAGPALDEENGHELNPNGLQQAAT